MSDAIDALKLGPAPAEGGAEKEKFIRILMVVCEGECNRPTEDGTISDELAEIVPSPVGQLCSSSQTSTNTWINFFFAAPSSAEARPS